MEETIFKSNPNQICHPAQWHKALDSGLELAIHSEDENLRLSIGSYHGGRYSELVFLESAVKYQILVSSLPPTVFRAQAGSQVGD